MTLISSEQGNYITRGMRFTSKASSILNGQPDKTGKSNFSLAKYLDRNAVTQIFHPHLRLSGCNHSLQGPQGTVTAKFKHEILGLRFCTGTIVHSHT